MNDSERQQELNNAVAMQIGKLVIDGIAKDAVIAELQKKLAAKERGQVFPIVGEAS